MIDRRTFLAATAGAAVSISTEAGAQPNADPVFRWEADTAEARMSHALDQIERAAAKARQALLEGGAEAFPIHGMACVMQCYAVLMAAEARSVLRQRYPAELVQSKSIPKGHPDIL
jgi:hypothetical protein